LQIKNCCIQKSRKGALKGFFATFLCKFLPVKQEILADKSEFAKKTVLFKREYGNVD